MDKKFLTLIKNGICENWERPALTDLNGATYLYKEFAAEIAKLHLLFEALEIQKGDKIALCDKNSSHWAIAFFASMSYGAVVTTILHDFNGESIENIVNHSEAKVLFAGEQTKAKIDLDKIPTAKTIIILEDFSLIKSATEKALEVQPKIDELFNEKYPNGFTKENIEFYDESPEELAVYGQTLDLQ